MNRDRTSSSNDPTAEPAASSSTQSASGLAGGRSGPGVEGNERKAEDDPAPRGLETPRRYEQPLEDDADPVMPADDATVNTKI